jgi:hypothetical protein
MQMLISAADQGKAGAVGVLALLLILDLETGKIVHRCEYVTPDHLRTPEHKIQFTGWTLHEGVLYACTHNEILVYEDWPPNRPTRTISLPGFNDLHHCIPWQGHLAVSNTGLETVDIVSFDGKLVDRTDLLADTPGARTIDPDRDYRLIPDTKPHLRHGNHLFDLHGSLWTSQLKTQDAICVKHPRERLEMEAGMPHDGDVYDNTLIFTTTNGHLVTFDLATDRTRRIYPLVDMTPELDQLGWCRGVCPVPGRREAYFVAFSSLRRSKWKDFGYWIKYGHQMPQSRVALYDLNVKRVEQTWHIGEEMGYQLFQIGLLPAKCWI